jgi:hypothetical protein
LKRGERAEERLAGLLGLEAFAERESMPTLCSIAFAISPEASSGPASVGAGRSGVATSAGMLSVSITTLSRGIVSRAAVRFRRVTVVVLITFLCGEPREVLIE